MIATRSEQEHLQLRHDRLVNAVGKMRGYQKEFFKYRAKSDLDRARQWERKVDEMIKTEVKEQQSKQGSIF